MSYLAKSILKQGCQSDDLIYAWNSAPVIGTNLPCSLIVTGRVFSFPFDFFVQKHLDLTSTPANIESYAKDQATLLSASQDIYCALVKYHHAWHREWLNKNRPDPCTYKIGDIVFARHATRSNAKCGRVGKLMYPMTGPWRVVEKLVGASYCLEHCNTSGRFDKKQASDLLQYPLELVPFEPINSPDNRFSQIFRPVGKSPYAEAGIKGFDPPQPFKLPANYLTPHVPDEFYWPSLSELNDECQLFLRPLANENVSFWKILLMTIPSCTQVCLLPLQHCPNQPFLTFRRLSPPLLLAQLSSFS
jgi:hypothetical protein